MKDRIVAFLLFLGKVAITGIVGVLAYIGFSGFIDLGTTLWGRPLNYYILPVIVCVVLFGNLGASLFNSLQILVIVTYLIASGFMSVYHMAVDTIFICARKIVWSLSHCAVHSVPLHYVSIAVLPL